MHRWGAEVCGADCEFGDNGELACASALLLETVVDSWLGPTNSVRCQLIACRLSLGGGVRDYVLHCGLWGGSRSGLPDVCTGDTIDHAMRSLLT